VHFDVKVVPLQDIDHERAKPLRRRRGDKDPVNQLREFNRNQNTCIGCLCGTVNALAGYWQTPDDCSNLTFVLKGPPLVEEGIKAIAVRHPFSGIVDLPNFAHVNGVGGTPANGVVQASAQMLVRGLNAH
jgi:hypothetical protein